jgi:hypothetical protein
MDRGENHFSSNLSTLLRWSPFSTEEELLDQVTYYSLFIRSTAFYWISSMTFSHFFLQSIDLMLGAQIQLITLTQN